MEKQECPMVRITVGDNSPSPGARNTIGGSPILAAGQQVPTCSECGTEMNLYLQFDLPNDLGLKLELGSHFLAFMCPKHNEEIPRHCFPGERPSEFWAKEIATFQMILNRPGVDEHIGPESQCIEPRELLLEYTSEPITEEEDDDIVSGQEEFKIGGAPFILNHEIEVTCGCGSPMEYFCQVPGDFGFQLKAEPEQPLGFSSKHGCLLFLGNIISFLACQMQCSPHAVTVILDN